MRWIVARAASIAALASTTCDFAALIAASDAASCALAAPTAAFAALHLRAIVVQHLPGDVVAWRQLLGALQPAHGGVELGVALRDDGDRGRALGLALRHHAFGGVDGDDRALQLRLGFTPLGLELFGVHIGREFVRR